MNQKGNINLVVKLVVGAALIVILAYFSYRFGVEGIGSVIAKIFN